MALTLLRMELLEVALASLEGLRGKGASSLTTHEAPSFVSIPACASRCTSQHTCISESVCLHICSLSLHALPLDLLASVFPQVLVTAGAPPHAHVGFYFCTCLFLHLYLCGSVAVCVSKVSVCVFRTGGGQAQHSCLGRRSGSQTVPHQGACVRAGVCLHVHRDAVKLGKHG